MIVQDPVYGEIKITDPCAVALIEHPSFARLWKVNQNGAQILINLGWKTSRAEHCIGVYHLLRTFGASREEQLSGLLHDANHLAFSHVIDYVFNDTVHQEAHHQVFPDNPHLKALGKVIEAHGFSTETILNYERYSLLEQPSGELCADRIDYTFRDGLNTEQTSLEEIHNVFIKHLQAVDGRFVMDDVTAAERLSRLSMDADTVRAGHLGVALFFSLARAIRSGLDNSTLQKEDLLTDDTALFAKMQTAHDPVTRGLLAWIAEGAPIKLGTAEKHHIAAHEKFRWVDPLVVNKDGIRKTSDLRPGLKKLAQNMTYLKLTPRYVTLPSPHDQFLVRV